MGCLQCTAVEHLAGAVRGRTLHFILLFSRIFDERRRRPVSLRPSFHDILHWAFHKGDRASCNIKIIGQDCQKRSRGVDSLNVNSRALIGVGEGIAFHYHFLLRPINNIGY